MPKAVRPSTSHQVRNIVDLMRAGESGHAPLKRGRGAKTNPLQIAVHASSERRIRRGILSDPYRINAIVVRHPVYVRLRGLCEKLPRRRVRSAEDKKVVPY